MKVLLTGSSGQLGRAIAPMLRRRGHHVIGVDIADGPETAAVGSVGDAAFVEAVVAIHRFDAVIHAAALHAPDLERAAPGRFIDVNVIGTMNLLDAAARHGIGRFILTSTTSLMVTPDIAKGEHDRAAWLDEDFGPLAPRNIYGVTKLTAEHLCRTHTLRHAMACIILRTSRFFVPQEDPASGLTAANQMANELLHRRVGLEDAALAHGLALEKAADIGFGTYIISAPPPFSRGDAMDLMVDAGPVIRRCVPGAHDVYARLGWRFPAVIDRVYDPARAEAELGFRARLDFKTALEAGDG
ncbi:MAG: NAD(P)-dependent oxidoreductase [Rhizobiaceae bacterium]|jgi:nucleoside-diphosphate-sugar epimerase|nr:NAD(P)-dependent oxidoreductase [Rhizobiaceae bacterium]